MEQLRINDILVRRDFPEAAEFVSCSHHCSPHSYGLSSALPPVYFIQLVSISYRLMDRVWANDWCKPYGVLNKKI